MRFPAFIKEGDTIGFVAPSLGCAEEPYKSAFYSALDNFKSMGFGTKLGPNCFLAEGKGTSNTPELCGIELGGFYLNPDTQALISCSGGELMCEDLDYVDFDKIREAEPKWFMGFSDNTNFAFILPTLCDVAAIYGPCAPAFGMEPWHPVLDDAMNLLTGESNVVGTYGSWEIESLKNEENPLEPYNCTEETELGIFVPDGFENLREAEEDERVHMHGRLLGGCLDCLITLCGTGYDKVREFNERYADDGVIWFVESCDLNTICMRRAMWQLAHAGWFDNAKGFIVGRPYLYDDETMGLDHYEAVLEVARHYNVPVVLDADLGHHPPSMPLVEGSLADVDAGYDGMSIDMNYVD